MLHLWLSFSAEQERTRHKTTQQGDGDESQVNLIHSWPAVILLVLLLPLCLILPLLRLQTLRLQHTTVTSPQTRTWQHGVWAAAAGLLFCTLTVIAAVMQYHHFAYKSLSLPKCFTCVWIDVRWLICWSLNLNVIFREIKDLICSHIFNQTSHSHRAELFTHSWSGFYGQRGHICPTRWRIQRKRKQGRLGNIPETEASCSITSKVEKRIVSLLLNCRHVPVMQQETPEEYSTSLSTFWNLEHYSYHLWFGDFDKMWKKHFSPGYCDPWIT